ncbi:MAG: hypothetical protein GX858_07160 [Clostridiales bacterium]|nr:hypothetical protein [Clostridiales bacterium]
MVSHILYPQLQRQPQPATMSRSIVTDLLRTKLGFSGLIVSDCMMMDAIAAYYGTLEGCKASAKAGMDLIFVSHDPLLAAQAADGIADLLMAGEIDEHEAQASEQRVLKAKRLMGAMPLFSMSPDADKECRVQAAGMAREALCLMNMAADALPHLGENPLCIGARSKRASIAADAAAQERNFAVRLAQVLGGEAFQPELDLSRENISTILDIKDSHSAFILGVQGNSLSGEESDLLQKLVPCGKPLICVALRTPYPLKDLPKEVIGMAAFDYSPDSLTALGLALSGQYQPTGKLPVDL